MMSTLKIYAAYTADKTLLKFLMVQSVLCLAYLLVQLKPCKKAKADMTGFATVFLLEAPAISYLALN